MAVTYNTALKNARLDEVTAALDAGTGAPTLEIGDAGFSNVLATLTLTNNPPAPSAAGGVLTFSAIADDTSADNTGTAALARFKDGDGTIVVSGLTVGTSGTDVILDSVSITAGQTVSITSATITHG